MAHYMSKIKTVFKIFSLLGLSIFLMASGFENRAKKFSIQSVSNGWKLLLENEVIEPVGWERIERVDLPPVLDLPFRRNQRIEIANADSDDNDWQMLWVSQPNKKKRQVPIVVLDRDAYSNPMELDSVSIYTPTQIVKQWDKVHKLPRYGLSSGLSTLTINYVMPVIYTMLGNQSVILSCIESAGAWTAQKLFDKGITKVSPFISYNEKVQQEFLDSFEEFFESGDPQDREWIRAKIVFLFQQLDSLTKLQIAGQALSESQKAQLSQLRQEFDALTDLLARYKSEEEG